MATGSAFYTYVLAVFKRTDKSTEVYEAITDAVMDIKLRYPFEDFKEEAYSTSLDTAGEYKLNLPDDFGHLLDDVILIDNTGGSKVLVKRSKATFDTLYPDREETNYDTGVPKDYCVYGGQIFVAPIPNKTTYVYQINYSTEAATTIDADTASVPFTDKYRWILREKVLEFLYLGLGNDTEGAKWRELAEAHIPQIIASNEYDVSASETVNYTDF